MMLINDCSNPIWLFYQVMNRSVIALFSACMVTACALSNSPNAKDEPPKFSHLCPTPRQADDGWRTSSVEEAGLDASTIDTLRTDILRGDLGILHSVLVVKDGVLVVEEYFNGAGPEDCQLIASVTKSFVSVLVGMAFERDPSTSIETALIDFFPEYPEETKQKDKSAIKLRHVLTMAAGLAWDETTYPHPDDRNPNTRMYVAADPVRFILDRKVASPPGKEWAYNSGLTILLGEVVRKISGDYIDKFAEANLFEPLGINRYFWHRHADGTVYTNGDLLLTPRDLAKIGLLVQSDGEWQGRQIVSRQWISKSTRRRVTTGIKKEFGYGYHWWIGRVATGDHRLNVIFGSGTGGQKLFIVPELNLVAVITAQLFGNSDGHVGAYRILSDYVIPASLPWRSTTQATSPDVLPPEAVAGKYHNPATGQSLRIVNESGKLFLKPTFFSRIALTSAGDQRVVGHWSRTGTIQIDFRIDATDSVTGLTANFLLRDRTYHKIE